MSRLVLCDASGPLKDLLEKLSGEDGERWLERLKKTLRESSDLLRRVAMVSVSAMKRFVANDSAKKKANIGWTSADFDRFFGGKIEENVEATNLAVHRLEKASLDAPILAELGARATTPLAYLFELMEKQSKGEDGVLLVNGYANIMYAIGNDGNVWAVLALWYSGNGCWRVYARSVEHPHRWGAGYQILSRDS